MWQQCEMGGRELGEVAARIAKSSAKAQGSTGAGTGSQFEPHSMDGCTTTQLHVRGIDTVIDLKC